MKRSISRCALFGARFDKKWIATHIVMLKKLIKLKLATDGGQDRI